MKNNNSTLEDPFSTDIIATINEVITYFSYLPYLFLYIIYIFSIIREKKISYLSSINLQLIFVCTLNTISFTLPSYRKEYQEGALCYFQAFINTLSDLSKTGIINVCTVGSYLSCIIPMKIDKYFALYFIVTTLIIWLPPLIFSIVAMYVGEIRNELDFCWIRNDLLSKVYLVIAFLYYIIFYVCLIGLIIQFRKLYNELREMKDKIRGYITRLIINGIIVTFIFITLCLNIIAFIFNSFMPEKYDFNGVFIFASLMERLSSVLLAVGFGLNTDKINELNKLCCCKNEINEGIENLGESDITIQII